MNWLAQRMITKVRSFMAPEKALCGVCGRTLHSPDSIKRGMGSVCFGRHAKKDTHSLDMFEAGTPGSEHGCG
jgi:hypothetical protein